MKPHRINQALLRRQTFLGCDRELTMSLLFLCALTVFFSLTFLSFVIGTILFASGFSVLNLMASYDPLMRKVMIRSLRYKKFYLAQAYALSPIYRSN